jgi:hypothetical protein
VQEEIMNELKALDREVQRSKMELDKVKPLYEKQLHEEEEISNRYLSLSYFNLGSP